MSAGERDGKTWSRQKVDFSGLPEMVRTFLQVAAGAADIPVTRLLGQSPSGMSATGESDTRNYYDMVSSRQEIDLRPQLERLDALLLRSAGVDPSALSFAFRPLWQMDAAQAATIALQKAQASQIYAGLNLWPASLTAKLVEAQLIEDGTYPGAKAIFAEAAVPAPQSTADFDPAQPRDPDGRWTAGGGVGRGAGLPGLAASLRPQPPSPRPAKPQHENPGIVSTLLNLFNPMGTAAAQEIDPEEEKRGLGEESPDPTEPIRIQRYANARNALKEVDPNNRELTTLSPPGYVPTEADIARLEAAARTARAAASLVDPTANGRLEPSPPGLVIIVRGNNTKEVGDSYSEQIREFYGGIKPPPSNTKGNTVPDGLFLRKGPEGIRAMEAKYVGNWSTSPFNPDPDKPYKSDATVDGIVDQALKYDDAYFGGVRWITNSEDFIKEYTQRFEKAGVRNFTFTYIPATREGRDGAYLDEGR